MIFVTVGTHEQPFDRLVREADRLLEEEIIKEKIIIQKGYSNYSPKFAESSDFVSYERMSTLIREARIVITHGGPASFLSVLQEGKIPVVVPRLQRFEEHVNDHQALFSHAVQERYNNIIVVDEIEKLGDILLNYEMITGKMNSNYSSHQAEFCEAFEKIADDLFGE